MSSPKDFAWPFWFTVPIYPYRDRRTLRQEVVVDTMWTFDQVQGILYTVIPVRMTVIKLAAGGLLVYAPVAPTAECLRLMNELVVQHGEVKYILLPTSSGVEHKLFVGPFARCFPAAQVFVVPHQWSYPIQLPLSWLGFPAKRTQVLPANSADAPFGDEFDYAILDIDLGAGAYGELALLHKRSRTLLITDTLLSVPAQPPAITQLNPYPLLFHARETGLEPICDTPENRRKGWQRTALFALYFQPQALETISVRQTLKEAWQASDRSPQAYFGLYPFRWQPDWQSAFEALRGNGRPFVAPILQAFILTQDPTQTLAWADRMARWDFERLIACHFDGAIATTPAQVRQAFAFLETPAPTAAALPEADTAFIRTLEANLTHKGLTSPAKNSP